MPCRSGVDHGTPMRWSKHGLYNSVPQTARSRWLSGSFMFLPLTGCPQKLDLGPQRSQGPQCRTFAPWQTQRWNKQSVQNKLGFPQRPLNHLGQVQWGNQFGYWQSDVAKYWLLLHPTLWTVCLSKDITGVVTKQSCWISRDSTFLFECTTRGKAPRGTEEWEKQRGPCQTMVGWSKFRTIRATWKNWIWIQPAEQE